MMLLLFFGELHFEGEAELEEAMLRRHGLGLLLVGVGDLVLELSLVHAHPEQKVLLVVGAGLEDEFERRRAPPPLGAEFDQRGHRVLAREHLVSAAPAHRHFTCPHRPRTSAPALLLAARERLEARTTLLRRHQTYANTKMFPLIRFSSSFASLI
jgi:hypothetical protein